MDLEYFQKSNQILYYNNLLKEDLENSIKNIIKNKINLLEDNVKNTELSVESEKVQSITENASDEYYFYKPWNKLATVHKIIKIKEFVDNLQIVDKNKRNELKKKLEKGIRKKLLTQKNSVDYCSEKAKIISISKLHMKNNNYYLMI